MLLARFVVMERRVFPLPRWAELITMVMTLNIVPPMIILKYSTAISWVSSLLPASFIIHGVSATNTTVMTAHKTRDRTAAVTRYSLACRWSCSPLRRATRADTATLIPKKRVRPMNFGWTVSPTAAIAVSPSADTIMVSIIPARVTKSISAIAGQATDKALRLIFPVFNSSILLPRQRQQIINRPAQILNPLR